MPARRTRARPRALGAGPPVLAAEGGGDAGAAAANGTLYFSADQFVLAVTQRQEARVVLHAAALRRVLHPPR